MIPLVLSDVPAVAAPREPTVTVVASGLDSPRGLDRLADGTLYLAEAGKGGTSPCAPGPFGEMCVGRTGRITHVVEGALDRSVGLSSIALPDRSTAFGPHDVALVGDRSVYATIGGVVSPESRDAFGPKGDQLGTLVRMKASGDVEIVADLAAYEASHNPDGEEIESDPYGILRSHGRSIVTDAAGNSLLRVTDRGHVSTLAVFPERLVDFEGDQVPMDAVPTSVVRGPDGAFYVGQLTGFPFPLHGARVYRVVPGEAPQVYARGFTNIIDIAFDRDGNLYVLEIAHNSLRAAEPAGALIKVTPDGEKQILLDEGLFFPTSIARQGPRRIFVTNCGVCAGGGEILQVDL